jgi:hypothetical protein
MPDKLDSTSAPVPDMPGMPALEAKNITRPRRWWRWGAGLYRSGGLPCAMHVQPASSTLNGVARMPRGQLSCWAKGGRAACIAHLPAAVGALFSVLADTPRSSEEPRKV